MHDLAIRNAKFLSGGSWQLGDLGVDEGKVSSFSPVSAKKDIDAEGALCIPGAVDLHVHFNEPGRTHWEGFSTGSIAAAAGGTTTLVEMPLNAIPSTVTVEALETKLQAIGKQSYVDFALWGGLVPGNTNDLQPLAEAGVAGFKAFMSPSGTDDFENSDVATLRSGMKEIAKTGKLLAIHAEDPNVLDSVSLDSKRTALDWESSRPVEAELSAVQIAVELSAETDCPIHIVHVSSPEVLKFISEAKAKGVAITCETCPHYLLLPIESADKIGPNAKCAPPLRPKTTLEGLWESLSSDLIDTIGTDHSPSPPELKTGKNFFEAWGGISGIQHGFPLLLEKAKNKPELFQKLLQLICSQPAELLGFADKGSLQTGMDADFSLIEVRQNATPIEAADLLTRHRESAYCGIPLSLCVNETWLRGSCIQKYGKPTNPPFGKFIKF